MTEKKAKVEFFKTMPQFGKFNFEKCFTKFKSYFIDNRNDTNSLKQKIISLSLNTTLKPEYIRPTSWKLFLKVLPYNNPLPIKEWLEDTYQKRQMFKQNLSKIKQQYADEEKAMNTENDSKKFSNFEENSSLKHLIEIDVERTYGDDKLFQDKYIRGMEENILYVFAQENKPTSYKQGMNEILALFILVFYPFYINSPIKSYNQEQFNLWSSDPEKYAKEIYYFLHDENELQSDLYYIMYNFMNMGANKLYDDGISPESKPNDQKAYLLVRCDYIMEKLKKHNLKLYQHFINIGLNADIILQRWLKCIFTREYTPEDCILIWDNILGNEFNLPTKNIEYIDYFCVGMFDYVSEKLLVLDQNECFLCLFKYPPFQSIEDLIALAEKVKANVLSPDKPSKLANIKNKITSSISNLLFSKSSSNTNNINNQKQDPIEDLRKITSNKDRIYQLKNILNKYKIKFYSDDKMKMDMLINKLEKNI